MRPIHIVFCIILAVTLSGCAQPITNPEPRYYLLTSNTTTLEKPEKLPSIAVVKVTVPDYLNAQGIALQVAENQIQIANFHRWAERPSDAITRVLHTELDHQLPGYLVHRKDQNYSVAAQYTLTTQIDQFHGTESGDAVLSAYWQLKRGDELIKSEQFTATQSLDTSGYAALVSTLRSLLTGLSQTQARAFLGVEQ